MGFHNSINSWNYLCVKYVPALAAYSFERWLGNITLLFLRYSWFSSTHQNSYIKLLLYFLTCFYFYTIVFLYTILYATTQTYANAKDTKRSFYNTVSRAVWNTRLWETLLILEEVKGITSDISFRRRIVSNNLRHFVITQTMPGTLSWFHHSGGEEEILIRVDWSV